MNKIVFFFSLVLLVISCNTVKSPLFGKRSPHEQYAEALTKSGLKESLLGQAWFEAADRALSLPQHVPLPYKETGFFAAAKPAAAGYVFKAVRGENIVASIFRNPDTVLVFLELWRPGSKEPSLIATMDTITKTLTYSVTKEDSLILRIQPELLVDLEYTLTISTQPSLAFPVEKSGNPRLISFWGNPRDAGARSHEGIDIGATFRTPVLAAAPGRVTRVNQNNLGGNVVFLRDEKTGNHLYYAHLDSQIAVQGQKVKIGDTLGLIGNTGNAKNTPPHLHFGIYTTGGAIDPLPFINPKVPSPPKIRASLEPLNGYLRTTKAARMYKEPATNSTPIQSVEKEEPVFILAATGNWYKVKLINNEIGYMESRSLTGKSLRQFSVKQTQELKLRPFTGAPVMDSVAAGQKVEVMAVYQDFYFVNHNGMEGWVAKPL